ncbi:hypothetical protein [Streptacidiphilus cavernicola]|uniref:Uncharacterized protein n=1 Tax=Streptacidiphilus cavernicola TaxID=3342716 RepID=A0ABV6VXU1_9ACTN
MSFASIKTALVHLFGIEETRAHALVEAVITDALPVLQQARQDITNDVVKLVGEAKADGAALYTEALADVKTEIAALKALINSTPAPAPVAVADPTPVAPTA